MNKSSSFYSEAYYEKARKQGHKRKQVYRQRNKQLYDQQHQLDILKYYKNNGRCEMIRYYELIAELFFEMKEKNIKGSDEYNQTVTDYIAKVNQKIKYFHQFLESIHYETREQRFERIKSETKQQPMEAQMPQQNPNNIPKLISPKQASEKQGLPRRLDTCNQCPIFIEEYQFNFQKAHTQISKQNSSWDKLNGNQKLAKFRKYTEQNLKILKFQLENKCEFATKTNHKFGRKMFGRP